MNKQTLKIYLFYCSNSLNSPDITRCQNELRDHLLKTISLPCSGKVDIPYLIKAFETGADGVVIITCQLDQCRHFEGNLRAEKRAEAVDSLLEEIGIDNGRIIALHIKEGQIEQTIEEIKNFCSKLDKIKPTPAAQGI